MEHIYDTLIIGGGPAGYTAALYAARGKAEVLVLEKISAGGQMTLTGEIDNYPGFEEGIDGFLLGEKMKKCAERFGAETRFAEVTGVDFTQKIKKIYTSDGTFYGKTVVIATGADPRRIGIADEKELTGKGVHYCAHCDGIFYKDKRVVVVGGGNSAASEALHLSRIASKVYLVHRRNSLKAEKYYYEPLSRMGNVEFIWDSVLTEIVSEDRVTGAVIKNLNTGKTKTVDCEGIFIAIGRKPNTDFLGGAVELDSGGYVVAGENTKTSAEGVFAAGDVRTKELRQIATAVGDGAVAGSYL
ncbi:MAG: thioredoxin-disulfide reductase [Ruminiclostridium sp.]|nr:thioredoxin-disulfide reductase [Ruminiclostridium sp.]